MNERSRSVLIAGMIVGLLVLAGTVSATTGGRTVGPAGSAVDILLYDQVRQCLESAIRLENRAFKAKTSKQRKKLIREALRQLDCAAVATAERATELEDGLTIARAIGGAQGYDTRALKQKTLKKARKFLKLAGARKRVAYTELTGNAPPPELNLGCEGVTDNAPGDDDEFAMRCILSGGAAVTEVEFSARRPITRFNDWAVVGNNEFRSGQCVRLAGSLVNCRIEPPMAIGSIFVVRLGGLGSGTAVVMEIVSGNRAQHLTLTTR